jgi:Predicted integral membrane protein
MPDELTSNRTARLPGVDAAGASIVVNAPVADVYARWLAVEEYPKFVTTIKSAQKLNPHRFAVSIGLNGHRQDAMLEIVLRVAERRVAWRTVSNGNDPEHFSAGVVSFAPCSRGSTSVDLRLTSSFGGAVCRRVDAYLRNFKTLVESPEC